MNVTKDLKKAKKGSTTFDDTSLDAIKLFRRELENVFITYEIFQPNLANLSLFANFHTFSPFSEKFKRQIKVRILYVDKIMTQKLVCWDSNPVLQDES